MTLLLWFIAAILAFAAFMLVTGTGAAGLWFAVIAVGLAVVAFARTRTQGLHR